MCVLRVQVTCPTCVHECPSVRVMGVLRVSDEPLFGCLVTALLLRRTT